LALITTFNIWYIRYFPILINTWPYLTCINRRVYENSHHSRDLWNLSFDFAIYSKGSFPTEPIILGLAFRAGFQILYLSNEWFFWAYMNLHFNGNIKLKVKLLFICTEIKYQFTTLLKKPRRRLTVDVYKNNTICKDFLQIHWNAVKSFNINQINRCKQMNVNHAKYYNSSAYK
jgi:hypothetical protein